MHPPRHGDDETDPRMKILMATAEYAPLAKTGGLADAVTGLARALSDRGHDVRVLLPRYAEARTAPVSTVGRAAGAEILEVRRLDADESASPRVYLADAPELASSASIYAGDERDAASFIRLSRAALELGKALGWRPDVLHCHDWHTALVPALAEARGSDRRATLLTVHNLGYQGIFGEQVLAANAAAELEPLRAQRERTQHTVNFLDLGIRFADAITTVSPTYAREIQRPELGMGLDETLRARGDALTGILNGVDYRLWSPETDSFLGAHFTREATDGKGLVKRALEAELGLPPGDGPLIGCVTRLVWQKGIDVLAAALPALLDATAARFALLGSGEPELETALADLARRHPARIAFRRGYDEGLAHRILAGSDFVLVPSRYEPCGLTQLYALRYGTIPIVRATGGLADSVRHFDASAGTGNGSVFEHADVGGILWGVTTALGWYADAEAWRTLVDNAMAADFSWAHQAPEYEALYERMLSVSRRASRP
ncbi:MAG TPA: glycogen synthase [Gammaproteobacteria bacterium]|nr:glycogen synthase [Gammaproteobacteria bacterium]